MLGAKGLWITTIILQIHIGRVAFCCDMLLLPVPPRHSSKMPTINNTCLLNMPSVEQGPQSVYVPLLIPYLLHTVYSSCWMSWRTAICCCARNVNIDGHSRHSKVSWHVLSPHSLTHSPHLHPYSICMDPMPGPLAAGGPEDESEAPHDGPSSSRKVRNWVWASLKKCICVHSPHCLEQFVYPFTLL